MGNAIEAQGRMIFGEFIYASGEEELHGVMIIMYWLYAFTFMIVMFFTLLNFFLAIVVDAYADVKEEFDTVHITEQAFPTDVLDILAGVVRYRVRRWPAR